MSPAAPTALGERDPWINDIPDEVWAKVTQDATPVDCEADEPLFWQGDQPNRVYVLLSGRVKITRNENGRELIIGLRVAGSFLGAAAALLEYEHPFSAQTLSACRLVHLQVEDFKRIAAGDHGSCLHLLTSQLREMTEDLNNASGVGCLTVRQRLEGFLRRLASSARATRDEPVRVELPMRHWELAQLIAITPEHLSRVLKDLEGEGLVQRRRGWLILPDPARLASSSSLADEPLPLRMVAEHGLRLRSPRGGGGPLEALVSDPTA